MKLSPLSNILESIGGLETIQYSKKGFLRFDTWQRIVGNKLSLHAKPFKYDHDVLWLRVSSAAWAQEIQFMSETIVEQLNKNKIMVKSLRCIVGMDHGPNRILDQRLSRKTRIFRPLPKELSIVLLNVPNDDLRKSIEMAMKSSNE